MHTLRIPSTLISALVGPPAGFGEFNVEAASRAYPANPSTVHLLQLPGLPHPLSQVQTPWRRSRGGGNGCDRSHPACHPAAGGSSGDVLLLTEATASPPGPKAPLNCIVPAEPGLSQSDSGLKVVRTHGRRRVPPQALPLKPAQWEEQTEQPQQAKLFSQAQNGCQLS